MCPNEGPTSNLIVTNVSKNFVSLKLLNYIQWMNEKLGSKVHFCSNNYCSDFSCSNLLTLDKSWKTSRNFDDGFEFCIIELSLPILVKFIEFTTGGLYDLPENISIYIGRRVEELHYFTLMQKLSSQTQSEIKVETNYTISCSYPLDPIVKTRVYEIIQTCFNWDEVCTYSSYSPNKTTLFSINYPEGMIRRNNFVMIKLHRCGEISNLKVYGNFIGTFPLLLRYKRIKSSDKLENYANVRLGACVIYASENRRNAQCILSPLCDELEKPTNDNYWKSMRTTKETFCFEQQNQVDVCSFIRSCPYLVIKLGFVVSLQEISLSFRDIQGDIPLRIEIYAGEVDLNELMCCDETNVGSDYSFLSSLSFLGYFDRTCILAGQDNKVSLFRPNSCANVILLRLIPHGGLRSLSVYGQAL